MQNDVPQRAERVLLVEDDAELRSLLAEDLAAAGFLVESVETVAQARKVLLRDPVSVAVLDVQLPDGSGFAVASHLRKHHAAAGVIMLSRHDDPAWQVAGLDVGADMYLPKPIRGEVLQAAVRSLIRRLHAPRLLTVPASAGWKLSRDGWQLDAPQGRRIALGASEHALLRLLAAEPGQVVSRQRLLATLAAQAPDGSFSSHRLDVLVHRLRAKIEQAGLPALPLQAVRGRGFVWQPASDAGTDSPPAPTRRQARRGDA